MTRQPFPGWSLDPDDVDLTVHPGESEADYRRRAYHMLGLPDPDPLTVPEPPPQPRRRAGCSVFCPALCMFRRHSWKTIDSPEPMYPGVSEWSGTKECRCCGRFAYWSSKETDAYRRETPWKQW